MTTFEQVKGNLLEEASPLAAVLTRAERRSRLADAVGAMVHVDELLARFRRIKRMGDASTYRMLPPDVRDNIHRLYGHKCGACGTTWQPTIDHIVPVAFGGTHDDGNLWTLCRGCNTNKGRLTRTVWAERRLVSLRQRQRELKASFSALVHEMEAAA